MFLYTKMTRFWEQYLEFDDPHGLHIRIIEEKKAN